MSYTLNAKWIKGEGDVRKAQYADGSPALEFWQNGGREVLSINLGAYGLIAAVDEVYVKNYSEGEGLAAALEEAGIARPIAVVQFGPYGTSATLMEVLV